MGSSNKILATVFCFVCLFSVLASAQLSATFYSKSCPNALATIKTQVNKAVGKEKRMGASLLRLHFHDCFVNGCDASVLLDDTATFTGEKTAAPNNGSLRGFEVIDAIKAAVEKVCPKTVSCADILAVAARDSVVALQGKSFSVLLGRRDSTTASFTGANTDIPAPTLSVAQLTAAFQKKNLDQTDLITLSGAHSIGQARCTTFRARLYNEQNISATFATSLKKICPSTGGDNNLAPLDTMTPNVYDIDYYTNLVNQKGLLHTDQVLWTGGAGPTDNLVKIWSTPSGSAGWFSQFATSMQKMGNISPLTGTSGQIRTNCRVVNSS